MATLKFLYRSSKDISRISLRLNNKDVQLTKATPFVSKKEYWKVRTNKGLRHKSVEELRGNQEVVRHKRVLLNFRDMVFDKFQEDYNNAVLINNEWFERAIDECHNIIEGKDKVKEQETLIKEKEERELEIEKANYLTNAIQGIFIKYQTNNDELKKFKTTLKKIYSYEEYMAQHKKEEDFKFFIKDFNQSFVENFKNWAVDIQEHRPSYAISVLKRVGRAIGYVYSNDEEDVIKISKSLEQISYTSNSDKLKGMNKIVLTLNFEELKMIEELKYEKGSELWQTQKAILIGCETGLRFSDFNKLIDENLYTDNINQFWKFNAKKTGKVVLIPKTKRIKELFSKYGEPFVNYQENDDIKLNLLIKRVCKDARIDNLVSMDLVKSEKINGKTKRRYIRIEAPKYKGLSTRTFRRSFATNYIGKVDTEIIRRITGHSTEKQLRAYIDVEDLSNLENSINQLNKVHY